MNYHEIILPENLESHRRVARVVLKANNYLRDIHTMLVLPKRTRARGQWGGCQFAITTMLCCVIEGISKRLYPIDAPTDSPQRQKDRARFRELFAAETPWAPSGAKWMNPSDAALKLYKFFRNDLVHGMALNDEGIIGNQDKLSRRVYLAIDTLEEWPSQIQIIQMEPVGKSGDVRVGRIKVVNAGLYWHTKRMIGNVLANRDMSNAEKRMTQEGITPLKF